MPRPLSYERSEGKRAACQPVCQLQLSPSLSARVRQLEERPRLLLSSFRPLFISSIFVERTIF
jgi:hypothetical protein